MGRRALSLSGSASDASNSSRCRSSTSSACRHTNGEVRRDAAHTHSCRSSTSTSAALGASASAPAPSVPPVDSAAGADAEKDAARA